MTLHLILNMAHVQPDGSFDHVFSAAALYHLPIDTQCDVIQQLLRLLVEGGTISVFWNGNHMADRPSPHPTNSNFFQDCIKKSKWPDSEVKIILEEDDVSAVIAYYALIVLCSGS